MRDGFKFLAHVESKTSPFEIVVKSLVRFNTEIKENESFKLRKLRTFGEKSRNILPKKNWRVVQ